MHHLHSISINFSRATSFWLFVLFVLFAIASPFLVYIDFDVPANETLKTQLESFAIWSFLAAFMYVIYKQYLWAHAVLILLIACTYIIGKSNLFLTIVALVLTMPALLFLLKAICKPIK